MVPWLTREHLREELANFMDVMLEPELSALGERILELLKSELNHSVSDAVELLRVKSGETASQASSVRMEPKAGSSPMKRGPSSDLNTVDRLSLVRSEPGQSHDFVRLLSCSSRTSKKSGAHKERMKRRLSLSSNESDRDEAGLPVDKRLSLRSIHTQDENSYSWMARHRKTYKEPVYDVLQDWQPATSSSSYTVASTAAKGGSSSPLPECSPRSSAAGSAEDETSLVQAVAPSWVQAASGWVARAGAQLWKQRHQESYRQLHLTQRLVINALSPTNGDLTSLEEADGGNNVAADMVKQVSNSDTESEDIGSGRAAQAAGHVYPTTTFESEVFAFESEGRRPSTSLSKSGLSESDALKRAGSENFRRPNRSESGALLPPTRARSSVVRQTRRLSEDILQFAGLEHVEHHSLRSRTSQGNYFEEEEESMSPWRGQDVRSSLYVLMAHVVQSPAFAYTVSILVLLNAALLGIQTDYMARHWTDEVPFAFEMLEKMLCVLFLMELAMRFYVFGCAFFSMPGWRANIFDLIVISFQVLDEFVLANVSWASDGLAEARSPLFTFGGASSWPLVRMLRLLRLVRIASLLHLLTELRMLVISIADSIKSVVWVLFLLLMIMYVIGVYFTQVVTVYKVAQSRRGNHVEAALETNYGTLLHTMLSLFETIASGVSWREVMDPLWEHCSPWMLVLFLGYVFFTIFVVLNVVTGVFVGSATEKANEDQKKVLMFQLRELFRAADIDDEGTMTWTKFQGQLQDPKMQGYLKAIDLDQEEALDLFHLLDSDDSDEIDEDEFVSGCIRLHGYAKSIDLATFMFDYKNYTNMWSEHAYRVERSLEEVADRLLVMQEAAGRHDVSV